MVTIVCGCVTVPSLRTSIRRTGPPARSREAGSVLPTPSNSTTIFPPASETSLAVSGMPARAIELRTAGTSLEIDGRELRLQHDVARGRVGLGRQVQRADQFIERNVCVPIQHEWRERRGLTDRADVVAPVPDGEADNDRLSRGYQDVV